MKEADGTLTRLMYFDAHQQIDYGEAFFCGEDGKEVSWRTVMAGQWSLVANFEQTRKC